jgi:hypothetical protein
MPEEISDVFVQESVVTISPGPGTHAVTETDRMVAEHDIADSRDGYASHFRLFRRGIRILSDCRVTGGIHTPMSSFRW